MLKAQIISFYFTYIMRLKMSSSMIISISQQEYCYTTVVTHIICLCRIELPEQTMQIHIKLALIKVWTVCNSCNKFLTLTTVKDQPVQIVAKFRFMASLKRYWKMTFVTNDLPLIMAFFSTVIPFLNPKVQWYALHQHELTMSWLLQD